MPTIDTTQPRAYPMHRSSLPAATRAPRPLSRHDLCVALCVALAALAVAGCQSRHVAEIPPTPTVVTATDDVTTLPPPAAVPANADGTAAATPAPTVFPVRNNLWDRVRAGFRFDLDKDNDRIAAQRNWYIRNQDYLDRVIARGSRYLQYIADEAEARDMPMEIALLPVVESAFDPYAYSRAQAAGPWQFIPSTGRIYGLKQDWWYDGRRDIEQSTRAALDYLERLAARFDGDYYKALAAYNAGAGTVSRAVTRNLRRGRKTDYWSLKVPQETSAYVPKLVALAQIVKDPAKYGMHLNPIADERRFVEVKVGRQIDLARAAELADMPLTELYLYNPGHNRWATDPQGDQTLLMPAELADTFRQVLGTTPEEQYAPTAEYEVVDGDTLESIAQKQQVSTEILRMVNHLSGDAVSPGETLVVPQTLRALAPNESTYEPRIVALNGAAANGGFFRSSTYTVRSGDTLSTIARKQHVSARDLARWNHISMSKSLRVGQRLTVQRGGGAPIAMVRAGGGKHVTHKVKRGETLNGIARKFKVSVQDIARWNDFSAKRQLHVGESVKLYLD